MAGTAEKILSYFRSRPRHRMTPAEILKGIGAGRSDLNGVVESLRALTKEGRVVRLKKNHYALPDTDNSVTGRVHAPPDGYGFLILDDRAKDDLYLSRREMRNVMHGDRVMARVERKRGGDETHIIQVLERGQKRLIGTYEEHEGQGYVIPMDLRIAPAIPLRRGGPKPDKGSV